MSIPYEWHLDSKIATATKGLAHDYEVHEINRRLDSMEHSLRESRAEVTELRAQLSTAQDALIQLQNELMERLSENGSHE